MTMVTINLCLVWLAVLTCYSCSAQTVINVTPKVFSTKRESNGLNLPATSTFQPIGVLTTQVHLTSPYTVFVHYQVTAKTVGNSLWTKLQVSGFNAGAIVQSGNQDYKTATGFWMANISPGFYTFEVHYKSSVSISVPASLDYQTAVLQVMWFVDSHAVSQGIKCYPIPTTTNAYNNYGPIRDLEAVLQLQSQRVVLAAYQFSVYSISKRKLETKMNIDNHNQDQTTTVHGNTYFSDHHSLLATRLNYGVHYFGVSYKTAYNFLFTDCRNKYEDNENLYAMYLPSGCYVVHVNPTTSLSFSSTSWKDTDLSYPIYLSPSQHVIVRYQYTANLNNAYIATRLTINGAIQPHTASIRGGSLSDNVDCSSNFGLWQGSFSTSGTRTFKVQHRSRYTYTHYGGNDDLNRAMDIVYCG